MRFKSCLLVVFLMLMCCGLGYAQKATKAKECSELQLKIREYERENQTSPTDITRANLDISQRNFERECDVFFRNYRKGGNSCHELFMPHKNAAGEFEYDPKAKDMFSPEAKNYFTEWNTPSEEEREYVESLLFYDCVPQFEKEERQKEALASYFAQCPKGITASSFDCYRLDEKFVNKGFRGVELEKNHENMEGIFYIVMGHLDYPENMEMYTAELPEMEMAIGVVDGTIRMMKAEFRGDDLEKQEIVNRLKKKIRNLKAEYGQIFEKTDAYQFTIFPTDCSLTFVSTKLHKIIKEQEQKKNQKKLEDAQKHAEDLF